MWVNFIWQPRPRQNGLYSIINILFPKSLVDCKPIHSFYNRCILVLVSSSICWTSNDLQKLNMVSASGCCMEWSNTKFQTAEQENKTKQRFLTSYNHKKLWVILYRQVENCYYGRSKNKMVVNINHSYRVFYTEQWIIT